MSKNKVRKHFTEAEHRFLGVLNLENTEWLTIWLYVTKLNGKEHSTKQTIFEYSMQFNVYGHGMNYRNGMKNDMLCDVFELCTFDTPYRNFSVSISRCSKMTLVACSGVIGGFNFFAHNIEYLCIFVEMIRVICGSYAFNWVVISKWIFLKIVINTPTSYTNDGNMWEMTRFWLNYCFSNFS